jgi:hypothetical protein
MKVLVGFASRPAADYNGCLARFRFIKSVPNNLCGLFYLTRSPSRIVCNRQGGRRGSKVSFWPDFLYPILDLCFIEGPGIVYLSRQESPLMNKKDLRVMNLNCRKS